MIKVSTQYIVNLVAYLGRAPIKLLSSCTFHRTGIKRKHHLICVVGILHFPNFIQISKDTLSINDGRNLFKRKGIMLNGKRRMNCSCSVSFSQVQIQIAMQVHFDPADLLADSSN